MEPMICVILCGGCLYHSSAVSPCSGGGGSETAHEDVDEPPGRVTEEAALLAKVTAWHARGVEVTHHHRQRQSAACMICAVAKAPRFFG